MKRVDDLHEIREKLMEIKNEKKFSFEQLGNEIGICKGTVYLFLTDTKKSRDNILDKIKKYIKNQETWKF